MATFVLIHGAWHGGWCWDRVVPLLSAAGFRELARGHGEGWRVPVPTPRDMGIVDEDGARWLAERLTRHPIATFEQPVRFEGESPEPQVEPKFFIHCLAEPPSPTFLPFAEHARTMPG